VTPPSPTPTPYRRTFYLAEGCRSAPDPSRLFRPLADLAHLRPNASGGGWHAVYPVHFAPSAP